MVRSVDLQEPNPMLLHCWRTDVKAFFIRIPWFYILFSVYPLLFLWTENVSEIRASAVVRPLIYTLLGSAGLFAILYFTFRNVKKATLMGALLLLVFFSYGHVYHETRIVPALGILSHHRILIPVYLALFSLGVYAIFFGVKRYESLIRFLNVASLVLVILQVFQLGYSYIQVSYAAHHPMTLRSGLTITTNRADLPDVYFIVLDSYMRADTLQEYMGFDNSAFIEQLKEMGFYVAQCSQSNYDSTRESIASTLNMEYLSTLEGMTGKSSSEDSFWIIIKNSIVRRQLAEIGYKTVSFRTVYPWLELTDADLLLGLDHPSIGTQYLYPFESTYLGSTAAILFTAANAKLDFSGFWEKITGKEDDTSASSPLDPDLQNQADTILFTLEKLTEIPGISGSKFVYAHLMTPHTPYVFMPNGELISNPLFNIGADSGGNLRSEFNRQGYIYAVKYINTQIIPVLQAIIDKSQVPPIIVLQGDHGYRDSPSQYAILNAYYLPNGYERLFPSITPVNTFRIIFDEYFGGNYPILPDSPDAVPDINPNCKP
jgi:hypothetical protein